MCGEPASGRTAERFEVLACLPCGLPCLVGEQFLTRLKRLPFHFQIDFNITMGCYDGSMATRSVPY
jgi:hypothetical protein